MAVPSIPIPLQSRRSTRTIIIAIIIITAVQIWVLAGGFIERERRILFVIVRRRRAAPTKKKAKIGRFWGWEINATKGSQLGHCSYWLPHSIYIISHYHLSMLACGFLRERSLMVTNLVVISEDKLVRRRRAGWTENLRICGIHFDVHGPKFYRFLFLFLQVFRFLSDVILKWKKPVIFGKNCLFFYFKNIFEKNYKFFIFLILSNLFNVLCEK